MNGYNVLKYGETGIAAPDMSFYDRLHAEKSTAGLPVTTITGVPPISFRSDGSPLSAWSIAGNVQQGETLNFCGDRTDNLFDGTVRNAIINDSTGEEISNNNWRCSNFINVADTKVTLSWVSDSQYFQAKLGYYEAADAETFLSTEVIQGNRYSGTFTIPEHCNYVKISYSVFVSGNPVTRKDIMLNDGSTALPYEPYGYKIIVTCSGHTSPIYIGDPLRKAIDGTDAVDILYSTGTITREVDADGNALATPTTQTIDVPPEIQTVRGRNTLTVDTDLQPSSISITGHIKSV